jgi:hypothetical protein
MDLAKIIIKSARAEGVTDFIDSLKQLPPEVVQGDFSVIEAYQLTMGASLRFVFHDKEEAKKIQFNVPKNSKNVKREDYRVEFEYNNRLYELKKEIDWNPC